LTQKKKKDPVPDATPTVTVADPSHDSHGDAALAEVKKADKKETKKLAQKKHKKHHKAKAPVPDAVPTITVSDPSHDSHGDAALAQNKKKDPVPDATPTVTVADPSHDSHGDAALSQKKEAKKEESKPSKLI
jgi:hypothetical protein